MTNLSYDQCSTFPSLIQRQYDFLYWPSWFSYNSKKKRVQRFALTDFGPFLAQSLFRCARGYCCQRDQWSSICSDLWISYNAHSCTKAICHFAPPQKNLDFPKFKFLRSQKLVYYIKQCLKNIIHYSYLLNERITTIAFFQKKIKIKFLCWPQPREHVKIPQNMYLDTLLHSTKNKH